MDAATTTTPAKTSEHGLSADEIRDFFNVGWITRRALFNADEVARMRACFDALERIASGLSETGLHQGAQFVLGENDGKRVIKRVVWAGGCQRHLLDVGSDPRLTVPAAQLLKSDAMDHLLNQAHFKRPRDGVTLLRAQTTFACIELSSGKPRRMPAEFLDGYGPALIGA